LSNKAITDLNDRRFMPPAERRRVVRVAGVLGMDDEVRAALSRLLALAESRRIGVAGRFMPDDGVSKLLAERGVLEDLDEADFFKVRRVIIPFCGIPPRKRREWEEAAVDMEDFTAAPVRRAQISLGLLRLEGAQTLVIGRHDDPESQAIAGGGGTKIIQDTMDTARLVFSPAFGVVCQTTLSPRRIMWLSQQLRMRYRDARVTILETVSPSMLRREEALEALMAHCDLAVIVGRPGEASCEALAETALRRGRAAVIVRGPQDLESVDFSGNPKVALSAGAFALDETIRAVAQELVGGSAG
jgi:4-hydroxy-3-methylbut-2-enyl diphosphate reductase IspH